MQSSTWVPWSTAAAAFAVLLWTVLHARPAPGLAPGAVPRGASVDARALDGGPSETTEPVTDSIPAPGASIPFERLEFPSYDPPSLRSDGDALAAADFPAPAGVLDGRDVRLEGFPLVVENQSDRVAAFLLTRFPPGCCFGALPVFDEWVHVTLPEPVRAADLPARARVRGRLEVGEELDDLGTVRSLYRLRAEDLEAR